MERNPNINMLFKTKYVAEWKKAYDDCFKLKSLTWKDSYDKFLIDIGKEHTEMVKKIDKKYNSISTNDMITFFENVFDKTNNFKDKYKKENSFSVHGKNNRLSALDNLAKQSKKVLDEIEEVKKKAEKRSEIGKGGVSGMLAGMIDNALEDTYKVNVDSDRMDIGAGVRNCVTAFVVDVPYLSFKKITFRMYVVITLKSGGKYKLENCFGNFDFKRYKLIDSSGNSKEYVDDKLNERDIYKAKSVEINVNVPAIKEVLGDFKIGIKVYISPNKDLITSGALKLSDIKIEGDGLKLKYSKGSDITKLQKIK